MSSKIFSFDAKTNGYWQQAFAIGAIVYDEQGNEIDRFLGRCPIKGEADPWVKDNVLPNMSAIPITHHDYLSLLIAFTYFYEANKEDADMVVHMGAPIQPKVLILWHASRLIGDWNDPCLLHDVAGYLSKAGEDPTACEAYAHKHNLVPRVQHAGGIYNPLYKSDLAAQVLMHLRHRTT